MSPKRLLGVAAIAAVFGSGYLLGATHPDPIAEVSATPVDLSALQANRTYELRTYTAPEGKFDDLMARFRDHTMRIFEKHGMENLGYWTPQDGPENTLIYIISHDSREQGEENWQAFINDPEWQQVAEESQRDGRIISGLERVWLEPTDYSPIK